MLIREEKDLNSITESKEYPIMYGINKNSLHRHRSPTKYVHIGSL
jgi:hypothetical protein